MQLSSPRIHPALFRDPDVYGFSSNNTRAVGGGGTAQLVQGLVTTDWGN